MKWGVVAAMLLTLTSCTASDQSTGATAIHEPAVTVRTAPFDVKVHFGEADLMVGEARRVLVAVQRAGEPIDLVNAGYLVHVTLVSEDLRDVQMYNAVEHLQEPDVGVYQFTHAFVRPGRYQLWVEINSIATDDHHGDAATYKGYLNLVVHGDAPTAGPLQEKRIAAGDATQVILTAPETVRAGELTTLRFALVTAAGESIPLRTPFDHHYLLAAPEHNWHRFYHSEAQLSSEQEAVSRPVAFREPGFYLVVVRLFKQSENPRHLDAVDAEFILHVVDGNVEGSSGVYDSMNVEVVP